MWHVEKRREMHTRFWGKENQKERHLGNLGEDGKIILKWIIEEI
jgi:hypothetical protein